MSYSRTSVSKGVRQQKVKTLLNRVSHSTVTAAPLARAHRTLPFFVETDSGPCYWLVK